MVRSYPNRLIRLLLQRAIACVGNLSIVSFLLQSLVLIPATPEYVHCS